MLRKTVSDLRYQCVRTEAENVQWLRLYAELGKVDLFMRLQLQ